MIKELNKDLIERANANSFGGQRGNYTAHDYRTYCKAVMSWGLSEHKTQKILDKVYDYFSKSLALEANHVSIAVAGGSNYNRNLDKSDAILSNAHDFCDWFKGLEEQATRKHISKSEELKNKVMWGIAGGYSTNKEWKELAEVDREEFNRIYETASKITELKKSSTPYKIYHDQIKVDPIKVHAIFGNKDFKAYEIKGKIHIYFRMKPQQQLIVALKSRGFHWDWRNEEWISEYSEDRNEWVNTIAERYENYI